MEENIQTSENQNTVEMPVNTSKRNLGVIISFIIVLLVISVVIIARLYPHKHLTDAQQVMTPAKSMTPVANVMYQKTSPTPVMDTSNAQLDKDIQTAQDNLGVLNTNLNTADQAINNQSSDTSQQ